MSAPEKISIKDLQKKAKKSPLRKGMIVRCLPMYGSWGGFAGLEFYVLSDKALAMWGHPMAIRHALDVDPDTYEMLAKAKDKDGKTLFYFTHLPADCVEILNQDHWTETREDVFLAEERWKEAWAETAEKDSKSYESAKKRWEETGDEHDKHWMETMHRFAIRSNRPWNEVRNIGPGIFNPTMLEQWVPEEE